MAWALAVIPVLLLIAGFPIFLVLLISSTIALVFFVEVPLTLLHQVMLGSVDSFTLMAVPFFIFAGELMARGGISTRIIVWVMSLIGWVRGSLGLTTVGTCTVFGAISGSGPAVVAAVGRSMYKPLTENGYGQSLTAGLLAASGGIATMIPPSIGLILYGAAAEQAVTHLFLAGLLPGLLLALCLAIYIYAVAARRGLGSTQPFAWSEFAKATKDGFWALMTPVIILGGIYTGIFSPTESAGVAAVYAIFVTMFIYRSVSLRELLQIGTQSMYVTAQIFIIIAAAAVYSWILTIVGVPQALIGTFSSLQVEPWLGLLIINVFLLLAGTVVDPASAILVMTPLLVPLVSHLGVDLIHFGVIMILNLEIGLFTPPFGLNIFTVQALFNVPLKDIYRGVVPFICVNIVVLFIVTYWPDVSLLLVRLLG